MKIKNIEINYHRNGVGGEGFHTGFFDWQGEDTILWRRMFYVIYEAAGHCSILEAKPLSEGNVKFLENSWRGDHFEPLIRKAIKKYEKKKYG